MKRLITGALLIVLVFALIFGVCAPASLAQPPAAPTSKVEERLPKTLFITAYDVGSLGYTLSASIGSALMKKYDIKLRLIPAGESIGRLTTLRAGMATFAFCGDETFFVSEGLYEFATFEWGPQPVRQVWAPPSIQGVLTAADAGIKTPYDLKGKRVAFVPGASSLNAKIESTLAFANLSWKDVVKVELPGYGAALQAIIDGKCDASISGLTHAKAYELERSRRGINWLEYPHKDKEGWERMQRITPWLSLVFGTEGPGLSKERPKEMWQYRYPNGATMAATNPDLVHAFVKALAETYDLYKDAHPEFKQWKPELSGVPPTQVPFHEGAIRYFKEVGVWKPEHDTWNEARLKSLREVEKLWKMAVEEATEKGIKEKDFPKFWMSKRAERGWITGLY